MMCFFVCFYIASYILFIFWLGILLHRIFTGWEYMPNFYQELRSRSTNVTVVFGQGANIGTANCNVTICGMENGGGYECKKFVTGASILIRLSQPDVRLNIYISTH